MLEDVPLMFDAVFECTLEMINKVKPNIFPNLAILNPIALVDIWSLLAITLFKSVTSVL